jgi:signal transduction histidine kinase
MNSSYSSGSFFRAVLIFLYFLVIPELRALDSLSFDQQVNTIDSVINGERINLQKSGSVQVDQLKNAISASESIQYLNGTEQAHHLLYQYYKKREDFQKALAHHDQYLHFKNMLFNESIEEIKVSFNERYDPEKKEAEIRLLRSGNELEALTLSRKRWILLIVSFTIAFLIILIILISRRYRIRQQSRLMVKAQNEKFNKIHEELLDANKELESSEHDLRRLNQTKDRFFSLISEELRNPLNSLSELLEILINEAQSFSKAEVHALAVRINDAVNSLLELIENLLQWSRIQMDQIELVKEEVSITFLIKENIQLLQSQVESKNINIQLNDLPEIRVNGDKNMLHFILRNLILNNIKFSQRSGQVSISQDKTEKGVKLLFEINSNVKEFGLIKNLWDSETKIGESMIKDEKTSLGLILTQYFVNKHSGALSIDRSDQSTIFSLTLPLNH